MKICESRVAELPYFHTFYWMIWLVDRFTSQLSSPSTQP